MPVYRGGDDRLLEHAYAISFVTAPAVNAGVVRQREANAAERIAAVMRGRTEKVLSLAVVHGHTTLVLGTWGCGVFRNDPTDVARWWCEHVLGAGLFSGAFEKVVFAVLDRKDGPTIGAFQEVFTANC